MKVLLDACVWRGSVGDIERKGHDVLWAGDWPDNLSDEAILARAAREGRVLVTLDKDFGELAVVHGIRHTGIIRLVGISARNQGSLCVEILSRYAQDIARGAIITVEPGRVRVRVE